MTSFVDPQRARSLLAALIDEAREPLLGLDDAGVILVANAAAAAKLKRTREHLRGKSFAALLEPASRRAFRRELARVSTQPSELDVVLIATDLERLVLRELPGLRPRSIAVTISAGTTIPPERPAPRQEEDITADAAALRRVFSRLPLGVISVYPNRQVAFANTQARQILDDARIHAGQKLTAPAALDEILTRVLAVPGVPLSQRAELPNGQIVAATGIGGLHGQPAVLMLEDITQKRHEADAIHEFLRNAAHQLRTPLTAIVTAIEVLQAGAKEDPAARDRFLTHIDDHARRLVRLARGLLVLARARAGEPPRLELLAIRPLLEEVARQVNAGAGVELVVECDPELKVFADGDLAREALAAIVENAAEHTRAGTIRISAEHDGGYAAISVVDTGSGILPEHRVHIFEPFYRPSASGNGHGLGLAIAAQAVSAMGGELTADDAEGGSRFTIRLASASRSK